MFTSEIYKAANVASTGDVLILVRHEMVTYSRLPNMHLANRFRWKYRPGPLADLLAHFWLEPQPVCVAVCS